MTHCDKCGGIARYPLGDGAVCNDCIGDDGPRQSTLADHGGDGQQTLAGVDQ